MDAIDVKPAPAFVDKSRTLVQMSHLATLTQALFTVEGNKFDVAFGFVRFTFAGDKDIQSKPLRLLARTH